MFYMLNNVNTSQEEKFASPPFISNVDDRVQDCQESEENQVKELKVDIYQGSSKLS